MGLNLRKSPNHFWRELKSHCNIFRTGKRKSVFKKIKNMTEVSSQLPCSGYQKTKQKLEAIKWSN